MKTLKSRTEIKRDFTPAEIAEGFEEILGVPLFRVLSGSESKSDTRTFDCLVSKWMIAQTIVRSMKGRDGEIVADWFFKIPKMLELDAKLAGNFGQREVKVPEDEEKALLQLLNMVREEGLEFASHLAKAGNLTLVLPEAKAASPPIKNERPVRARTRRKRS